MGCKSQVTAEASTSIPSMEIDKVLTSPKLQVLKVSAAAQRCWMLVPQTQTASCTRLQSTPDKAPPRSVPDLEMQASLWLRDNKREKKKKWPCWKRWRARKKQYSKKSTIFKAKSLVNRIIDQQMCGQVNYISSKDLCYSNFIFSF